MNCRNILIMLGLMFIVMPLHAEEPLVQETVLPFLQALQTGDVQKLESLLAGKMLRDNQVLLQKNKGYPEFLRNQYKGAVFQVTQVNKGQDEFLVSINVSYPDGNNDSIRIRLKQIDNSGSWRIVEQLKDF